jgi:hypothetical protein
VFSDSEFLRGDRRWTLAYASDTLLHGLPPPHPAAARSQYDAFLASPAADALLAQELRLRVTSTRLLRFVLRYVVPLAIVFATFAPAFASTLPCV